MDLGPQSGINSPPQLAFDLLLDFYAIEILVGLKANAINGVAQAWASYSDKFFGVNFFRFSS